MTVDELLQANDIHLESTAPGEYSTICPKCSHGRKKDHQKIKCLGVKIDDKGVCWGCNHCGWKGPEKGTGGKRSKHNDDSNYSTIYRYVDANGNLLWEKLRFRKPPPKRPDQKFTQRKPDGRGGWIWEKVREGLPSVLYRLPEVIAAIKAGKEIALVEGEKDADNLWALGIPATCSPDGAADPKLKQRPKWKAEHSAQLRGAPGVIVMGDHDAPGYMHQDVSARMLVGVAKRVRVLKLAEHWPECPENGDVSDWLAAGHTRDELLALLANAPDYQFDEPNRPGSPADGGHHDKGGVSLDDFRAYMPQHNYIYIPTREPWPASSVNARIPPVPMFDKDGKPVINDDGEQLELKASTWLDQNHPVEQMTWAPGLPMEIPNRLVSDGGLIIKKGVSCLNLYRPPTIELGDATKAGPWLEHTHKVFGEDAEHIIKWLAQRVQHPEEKINHALVLGSKKHGIGKDATLQPVKHAIGPWNFQEISQQQLVGRFNGFLKKVILRVNEARDLGDVNCYQFYDHTKSYTASPPDVLRVDEKNLREHSILNCVGLILTTNHKTDGIYLPAEDRRHYVAWTDRTPEDFEDRYWNRLWRWYDEEGGNGHVAAYLAELDISTFDPKAPPPKTAAFWDIVEANRAPEDAELADVLDKLGNPAAITLGRIRLFTDDSFNRWLSDRRNSRAIPYRLERCGYVAIRNETNDQGFWIVDGRRQVVYAKATLSVRKQIQAASKLSENEVM